MPKTYDEHKAEQREQLALADVDPVSEPDRCPDGELINPDPPELDGVSTWKCSHGHFGYLLPGEYLTAHPDDARVQVCGRKRLTSVPASVVA